MKKNILYTFAALGFCSVLAGSCIAEDLGVGNIKQEENANSDWKPEAWKFTFCRH